MGTGFKSPSVHSVPQRVLDRVWDHVDIRGPGQCWPWQLSTASHGYGQMGWWVSNKPRCNAGATAHRIVWHSLHGSIPEGMTIDHLCKNRPCCNPFHLRLLTNVANATDNGRKRAYIDADRVRELHDEGYRQAAIARIMGISASLVRRSYADQGLKAAPCGQPRKGTISDLVSA